MDVGAAVIETHGLRRAFKTFLGNLGDRSVVKGVVLMAVLCLVSIAIGARAFGRAVA